MAEQMKWMLQTKKCRWFGYRKLKVKKRWKKINRESKKKKFEKGKTEAILSGKMRDRNGNATKDRRL